MGHIFRKTGAIMYCTTTRHAHTSTQKIAQKRQSERWIGFAFAYILLALAIITVQPALAEVPHPKGCADDEIFISSQDWWLTTPGQVGQDGQPGEDFGHLHTELCFPHKATLSGEMTLDVTSVMHDNPGDFYKLVIQLWAEGWSPSPQICGEGAAVACKEFDPPRTFATCESSGGTLLSALTCKWQDSLTFDISQFPYDGWQQFRVRGKVDQADGSSMRTSTGLHAWINHGKPINHVYENPDRIEGRGWYTDAEYAETSVKEFPSGAVSGLWAPWLEMTPGSGGIPVTSHRAAFDAAIHLGDLGTEIVDGSGPFEGRVMLDTTTLSNGWHKLFLRSSQFEPISGSTNSSISVTFFEVLNQSPPACEVLHLEPVVADAYVRGDSYGDANFGDDDELIIKGAGSDFYTRRAYLRFDLTRFAASSADNANFTAEVNYHQTPGVSVPLKLYSVASDTWDESTLTWNNQPGPGALLGTINVSDVGPVSFDLTSYVNAELAGDKTVSLVLLDDSGTNQMLRIRSRSVEIDPPSLTLTASASECTPSGTTNNAPTAGFTFSTTGLDASFTDTSSDSDGTVTGWSWDFGDGNNSSDQTPPVHSYAAAGTYTVVLSASDDGGASDTASQPVTVTAPPDNEAPTMPPALWIDGVTTNRIDLLWSASTDNVEVTGYELLRDGSSMISVAGTAHSDSGLSPNETHAYQVRAFDAAGNNSALTTEVTGTTNSETADVITVIEASYKANRDEFKVRATSSDQPDVSLEVLGFGPMIFSKGKYEFKLRPVGGTVIPATIVIESSGGGMISVPVIGAPEPPPPPAPPGQAGNPSPTNGAIDVSVNATLGWSAGSQADTHNVYFGTSASPPRVPGTQTGTSYDPGTLAASTIYYWRVDEVNAVATTTGVEWSFTTGEASVGDTVVITKAEWKASRSELKVEATSSGAPGAVLSLVGYTQMSYDSRKNIYKLTLRPGSNPGAVTVSSDQGGNASKTVTVR